jgi:hypothetical protein
MACPCRGWCGLIFSRAQRRTTAICRAHTKLATFRAGTLNLAEGELSAVVLRRAQDERVADCLGRPLPTAAPAADVGLAPIEAAAIEAAAIEATAIEPRPVPE